MLRQMWGQKNSDVAGLAVAGLVYFALARFGMALFALQPSNITLIWLPSGIALVMYLQWGYRSLPVVALASFTANYPGLHDGAHAPLLHVAINGLADGSVGLISGYLLRRFLPNGLTRTNDLLPFGFWVCIVPTAFTSLILSFNLAQGGYIPWHKAGDFLLTLMLGDSLGILLVYQIYQGWRDEMTLRWHEKYWLAGTSLGVLLLLLLGFTLLPGAIFFILPLLLILSFNAGLAGIATISSLAMVCIIAATAHNVGPFVAADVMESNFRLMAFVFSSALTILGIALQNRQLSESEHSGRLWKTAAEHVPVAGRMNRRAFLPRLQNEQQRTLRNGSVYTFAMLDLDHFKLINDTYGHHSGDGVLRLFATIMQESCRSIDMVVRMGGEEFGILFPECDEAAALIALERIRRRLEDEPLMVEGNAIRITVSVGVAAFSGGQDADVIDRADKALYRAKDSGRNRIIIAAA